MALSPRLLRPIVSGDPDARRYIEAVQRADGNTLEPAVRLAINDFVVGCKADGIWSAIKASCILVGARTLSGALTPLVGAAPTNDNFVSGDYDRKNGLIGNGSTKRLDSNRNNTADPQDNRHLAVYVSADATTGLGGLIGTQTTSGGGSWLFRNFSQINVTSRLSGSTSAQFNAASVTGFVGNARSSSSSLTTRLNAASTDSNVASTASNNESLSVFMAANFQRSNARIAYYSIGESLALALLDSRVSTLYTAIGAAI